MTPCKFHKDGARDKNCILCYGLTPDDIEYIQGIMQGVDCSVEEYIGDLIQPKN